MNLALLPFFATCFKEKKGINFCFSYIKKLTLFDSWFCLFLSKVLNTSFHCVPFLFALSRSGFPFLTNFFSSMRTFSSVWINIITFQRIFLNWIPNWSVSLSSLLCTLGLQLIYNFWSHGYNCDLYLFFTFRSSGLAFYLGWLLKVTYSEW